MWRRTSGLAPHLRFQSRAMRSRSSLVAALILSTVCALGAVVLNPLTLNPAALVPAALTPEALAFDRGSRRATFSKDVAPILYKNCVACHRPNELAPMSLLSYKEARPWARSIREKIISREMPPWSAD